MKVFYLVIFNSFSSRRTLFYEGEMEILNISCSPKTFSVLHREKPTGMRNQISAFSVLNVYFISMPILHAMFSYLVRELFMDRKYAYLLKFQSFAIHSSV